MAQFIILTAHGQWVVGGVRKGIRPQLLLCSKDNQSEDPLTKTQIRVSHRLRRLYTDVSFFLLCSTLPGSCLFFFFRLNILVTLRLRCIMELAEVVGVVTSFSSTAPSS